MFPGVKSERAGWEWHEGAPEGAEAFGIILFWFCTAFPYKQTALGAA